MPRTAESKSHDALFALCPQKCSHNAHARAPDRRLAPLLKIQQRQSQVPRALLSHSLTHSSVLQALREWAKDQWKVGEKTSGETVRKHGGKPWEDAAAKPRSHSQEDVQVLPTMWFALRHHAPPTTNSRNPRRQKATPTLSQTLMSHNRSIVTQKPHAHSCTALNAFTATRHASHTRPYTQGTSSTACASYSCIHCRASSCCWSALASYVAGSCASCSCSSSASAALKPRLCQHWRLCCRCCEAWLRATVAA